MFNRKNLLQIGDYSHKFGQGGPLSQDQIESKNEDDLLLEELYKFILSTLPDIFGSEIIVNNTIYHMIRGTSQLNFLTVKMFILEHYPRGRRLIFDEDTDYYVCVSVYCDGIEIGLIDSDLYYDHIINKTPLLLDETTREITRKFDFDKFEMYDSGDITTDCGFF